MRNQLKIISVMIFTVLLTLPAQADPLATPTSQAAPKESKVPIAPTPVPVIPVQTDTVQTDHVQKEPVRERSYNYAHDDAEYSVTLPEAPTVSTIWAETAETKSYLKAPPADHGALGETATFKLVDIDTEETFDVKITFLRATPQFLESLNKERIQKMLEKRYSEVALSNESFNLSDGASTLKWATLSGFTLDSHHHPAFYAIHYLTGLQSILVIEVKYSIENKTFQNYYNRLVKSVTYVQP